MKVINLILLTLLLCFILSSEFAFAKKSSKKGRKAKKSKKAVDSNEEPASEKETSEVSEKEASENEDSAASEKEASGSEDDEAGSEDASVPEDASADKEKAVAKTDKPADDGLEGNPEDHLKIDFENTSVFGLPLLYARLAAHVAPKLLFRSIVSRFIPFLIVTGYYYSMNTGVDFKTHLWVVGPVYVGMEFLAFTRYWAGEVQSALARRFYHWATYSNGSIMFESTALGLDVPSLMYLPISYAVLSRSSIVGLPIVPVSFVIVICVYWGIFHGFPLFRHVNILVFGFVLSTFYLMAAARLRSFFMAIFSISWGLYGLGAIMNDGASHFEYPPSMYTHFKKYDTPSLGETLSEVGFGGPFLRLILNSIVVYGIPAGVLFGLFKAKDSVPVLDLTKATYISLYIVYVLVVFNKFVFNDIFKSVGRRNFPFLVYYNGSLLANTTFLWIFKAEFFSLLASIIFCSWVMHKAFANIVKGSVTYVFNHVAKFILDLFSNNADCQAAIAANKVSLKKLGLSFDAFMDDLVAQYTALEKKLTDENDDKFFKEFKDDFENDVESALQKHFTIDKSFFELLVIFKSDQIFTMLSAGFQYIVSLPIGDDEPLIIHVIVFCIKAMKYMLAVGFFIAMNVFTIALEFLHPVFSTTALAGAMGGLVYLMKKLDADTYLQYAGPLSASFLPWMYVFIRKEGIVSWTSTFRSGAGVKVSIFEFEEEKRLALEAKKEKAAKKNRKAMEKRRKRREAKEKKKQLKLTKEQERAAEEEEAAAAAAAKAQAEAANLASEKAASPESPESPESMESTDQNGNLSPDGTSLGNRKKIDSTTGKDNSQETGEKTANDAASFVSTAFTALFASCCIVILA